MTRLPNFIVLGQGKAGTSFIYKVLSQNPEIGLSIPKELHYFPPKPNKDPEWYADKFAHIPQDIRMVGEVSPSYLRVPSLTAIADTLGRDTKVIFILRHPIERAYSRYLQNICASQEGDTFRPNARRQIPKHLENLEDSIQACFDIFGEENTLALQYEHDIVENPLRAEQRILDFLGLPPTTFTQQVLDRGVPNFGVMPRYVYSGETPLSLSSHSRNYDIPPRHLIFCAQQRNSVIYSDPSAEQVLDAFARQSVWSGAVTQDDYRTLLKSSVLSAAERLEKKFGFNLDHWRTKPKRIIYEPAPPPKQFLRKPK